MRGRVRVRVVFSPCLRLAEPRGVRDHHHVEYDEYETIEGPANEPPHQVQAGKEKG
jgi:hypothetical protein